MEEDTASGAPSDASQDRVDPDSTQKSRLVFIILAILLCGGLLAFVFVPKYIAKQEFESNKYNHFEFVREAGSWVTVVNKGDQPYRVPFYYHPRDLEGIVIDPSIRGKLLDLRDRNGSIFITVDPDAGDNKVVIAGVEIAKITGERYGILNVPTHSAFIKPAKSATANTVTPIKTCKDANAETVIIWITLSDKNIASSSGNCIILEGKSYNETVMVADSLVYHLFGIMS